VILMDEPLSNLDAKLRVAMRGEISDLQWRLQRTILFVTHDQEEAMSIADTIYLFNNGQVLQKGAPKELYENPKTRYAAEFLASLYPSKPEAGRCKSFVAALKELQERLGIANDHRIAAAVAARLAPDDDVPPAPTVPVKAAEKAFRRASAAAGYWL